ncbi:hypothetical protein AB0H58_31450 [Nocardia neocaledoniensis]|uniref:hypothetical protein n=1 Tax=Nocardia neocaledoniensis TaxID=236511 RepID=UPI0033EDBCBA
MTAQLTRDELEQVIALVDDDEHDRISDEVITMLAHDLRQQRARVADLEDAAHPRQIDDPAELAQLPIESIVRDPERVVWIADVHADKPSHRRWSTPFGPALASSDRVLARGRVTVLHTGKETC